MQEVFGQFLYNIIVTLPQNIALVVKCMSSHGAIVKHCLQILIGITDTVAIWL